MTSKRWKVTALIVGTRGQPVEVSIYVFAGDEGKAEAEARGYFKENWIEMRKAERED